MTPTECASTKWDAIVVGTGMGGATAGYELSRLGRRVLFVEKGPFLHGDFSKASNALSAAIVSSVKDTATNELVGPQAEGLWPNYIRARTNLGEMHFRLPVGCTSGGSSAFYAMALERFSPADFKPGAFFGQTQGTTLPECWPIDYSELSPWYTRAEKLYRVRGTQDPLHDGDPSTLIDPPILNPRDRALVKLLQHSGLHPYQLHVGCEFVEGCNGCLDGPCQQNCKRDAAWTCLIPALEQFEAHLLPNCELLRLEADSAAVKRLICMHGGTELQLESRIVVLAAGAFNSPAVLLRSASPEWPDGLANTSGLVGRNLMFHGGDLIAIRSNASLDADGVQKTLALNDFYTENGVKLGTFQSLGTRLDIGQVMQYMRNTAEYSTAWWRWLVRSKPVWWRKLTSPFIHLGALVYFRILNFDRAAVWVSIIEDLPYRENRVYPDAEDPSDVVVEYCFSDELKGRVQRFRELLAKVLAKKNFMILSDGKKIDYPHVCGTCRFGDDPAKSVLDRDNRAHGVTNLYVLDASFFPSSSGTNPSLTIAANALRVANVIDRVLIVKDDAVSTGTTIANRKSDI